MRAVMSLCILCLVFGGTGSASAQNPPPTPTTSRPAPLASADQALMNGSYETAIAEYANAAATAETTCEGTFGVGITYLRAARPLDAVPTLTQHIDACGASLRSHLLRGDARRDTSDTVGALADYEAALNLQPGLVDSYIFERIASVNPDASVLYLRLAAEARREPQGEYVLRSELAQIYRLIDRPDEALIQYQAILTNGLLADEQSDDEAAIEVLAANLELSAGNTDAAYARLQRVVVEHQDEPAAFEALVALINAGQPVDLLARMRINVRSENYAPVIAVLSDYLAAPPADAAVPAELYILLGRSQRAQGDFAGALASLQQVQTLYPTDPLMSVAAFERGLTYQEAGDDVNASTAYMELVSSYPQSPEAPRALLRAARIAGAKGDGAQAVALYEQLAAQYPGSEQTQSGLLEIARVFQTSDPARAADLFGRAGSAQGFIWQGKLLQALGSADGAQQAWQAALSAQPGEYFSLRACALLNNIIPYEPSSSIRLQENTPEDLAAAEAWMSQRFGAGTSNAALSAELTTHPLLVRGSELWALGWQREANAEFVALHRLYRDDPLAMFQLATYYHSIQAYRAATTSATRLVFLANTPLPGIPVYIARFAYPIYFPDLVIPSAQAYDLDPLYVASLIRQESTFDAAALSIAGARGLMQLMPATAEDVASRLGLADYTLDDLSRPTVNINMGTFYLDSARDFLEGDVVGALLGYNAGPGRAAQWTSEAGGDIDVLYDTIPFEETRLYLETIYRNFAAYRYLYGDGMPDCMFTVAPPEPPAPAA